MGRIGQDGQTEQDKHAAEITDLKPGRELAGPAAVDRPAGQAVPQADEEPHRLREEDRMAVLDYLHEHPRHRDHRRSGQPTPQYIDVVHREDAVVEIDCVRTAKAMGLPDLQDLAGQQGLGHRGEHRRRPDRLDPPPRPPRPQDLKEAEPEPVRTRAAPAAAQTATRHQTRNQAPAQLVTTPREP
jgi:hypothetical protein